MAPRTIARKRYMGCSDAECILRPLVYIVSDVTSYARCGRRIPRADKVKFRIQERGEISRIVDRSSRCICVACRAIPSEWYMGSPYSLRIL